MRVGDNIVAAREAERAVQAFPSSTFARICLAMALHYNEVSVDSLQRVVDDVLSLDSLNIIAAVMRATILEADRRPNDAALAWARVAALRGDSLELAITAVEHLVRLDHPALAATVVTTLIKGHPTEPRLRRFLFRLDVSLQRWQAAAALGDSLEAEDAEFRADSSYAIRHVEALRMIGDTLSALAKSARAVKLHPGDGRLYLQYVQLVGSENGVMLDRGIKLFPDLPELRVLAARVARAAGNKGAELAALRDAVRNDPSMAQGFLRIAEIWFQDNHADSALAALRKAPREGPSTELLRTYVEGRGMQLVRAASDTMPESFHAAVGFFVLADSVDSRDDSRSLIVASMLQLAQSELAVAAKARSCPGVRRADEALIGSAAVLARGVGTGSAADELRDAQVKLRAAVGNASKVLCG
ncbi:MAG: tetratricopeptide repeat protein [Gemmatimonadales bacterium]